MTYRRTRQCTFPYLSRHFVAVILCPMSSAKRAKLQTLFTSDATRAQHNALDVSLHWGIASGSSQPTSWPKLFLTSGLIAGCKTLRSTNNNHSSNYLVICRC
uniref:Uncharacterized protein n=1 Tax=Schizaphis graminum TaxID=13262 RepID=A0A2S2N7M0_SCHGA